MLQFIFTNILLIATGTMLYLFIRSLPRTEEEEHTSMKSTFMGRFISSELPERIDAVFHAFLAKFLRRARVMIMKIDNTITVTLKKLKAENSNGKAPIDFKEIQNGDKSVEN